MDHDEFMRMVNRMGELAGKVSSTAHALRMAVAFTEAGVVPPQASVDLWKKIAQEALDALERTP